MLLARAASTSAGYPLDVYDFTETVRRAEEAREIGRALEFATPRVSAAVDLAFVAARTGAIERALTIVDSVKDAISNGGGFHGWIWRSRLAVLRAEICLATGDHATALALSSASIPGLESLKRVKYRLLAEHVRARALLALGRTDEAASQARLSFETASSYPDPAMLLRAAVTLHDVEPDARARDALVSAASRIERALPTESARVAFRAGAPLAHAG